MLCISSNEHYLVAGIDCYNNAINKLISSHKQDLALKLCVEVGKPAAFGFKCFIVKENVFIVEGKTILLVS